MESGIYKITNLINNKVYIGQSRDLKTRIYKHNYYLKNNQHINKHLQNSYNKYGIESFKFEIIEYCTEDLLNKRECHWILKFESCDRQCGYNSMIPNPDENKFYHSDESKQRMSDSLVKYDKDDLISYLQEYYYHFGKVPTSRDLASTSNYPTIMVYFNMFGSYKEALIEADLYDFVVDKSPFTKKEYTKDEILQMFRDFIEENGRFPTHQEFKFTDKYNLPSKWSIDKHFGGRKGLKKALNYIDVVKEKELELALEGLRKLYEQDGKVNATTIDKSSLTRSASYYTLNFGSKIKAYEMAGIPIKRKYKKLPS